MRSSRGDAQSIPAIRPEIVTAEIVDGLGILLSRCRSSMNGDSEASTLSSARGEAHPAELHTGRPAPGAAGCGGDAGGPLDVYVKHNRVTPRGFAKPEYGLTIRTVLALTCTDVRMGVWSTSDQRRER